jgi:hypothetical protein
MMKIEGSGSAGSFVTLKNRMLECSVVDPDPDPYPDSTRSQNPYSESGSGYRRAKMTHKRRKQIRNFYVLKCWMFYFLTAEGFFCNLDSFMEA